MLMFLDIKTTGFESDDKICALSLMLQDEDETVFLGEEFVNEGKKIAAKASARHHVTNEMIADKGAFKESEIYTLLEKYNNETTVLVVHNASFVLQMLREGGFTFYGKIIDTLRVSRHLMPECELFSLQFLRYELKLYTLEPKNTQSCFVEAVIILELLYKYLEAMATPKEMFDLSFANVLLQKFPFGKYKERYIEEIVMQDRNYCVWLLSLEDLDEDLHYSLEYYLDA